MFFDPRYDGFSQDLEYLCQLPSFSSMQVESSRLGVGFELLDHRTGYDFQKTLPIARQSGVKWARLQSGWQRAEKEPGKYDFAWLDEIVDGLLDAGIRPWFSLSFGNGYFPNGRVHSQGVIDATDPENYRPKLAFRAMQSFAYLFDSRTTPMNACFELYPQTGWGINTLPLEVASGLTCAFRRGNIPLFAYYHPTHIDADWQVTPVRIQTWVHDSMKFEKPVLIDPITARVYRIRHMTPWCDGNYSNVLIIPRLPLLDYPLFVTDASLLDEIGRP